MWEKCSIFIFGERFQTHLPEQVRGREATTKVYTVKA